MRSSARVVWLSLLLCAGWWVSAVALADDAHPKVCVTLAGGVARGFAFLGALEELVMNGVPVDCLVGTSAGALVGGLYASGYSFETLHEMLPQLQEAQQDLVRVLSPPINGLFDPSGFEVLYRTLVDSRQLEQTEPRLAVMATLLRPGSPAQVLKSGDLARAIRASISLPLIFPPVLIDGRYYADGGLRDPFPVHVARNLGADMVISIRALPQEGVMPDNLLNTLNLAVGAATTPPDQPEPDLWIRVPTYDTLYFDFSRVLELIERGRKVAHEAMPAIQEALEAKGIALRAPGDPHQNNQLNQNWQRRLARGLGEARAVARPFSVLPVMELGPSDYDGGTTPGARTGFSSLGVGAELTGGPLGAFSLKFGYANALDSVDDAPFVQLSYGVGLWRFSALYDPVRRPVDAPWQLEARFDGFAFHAVLGVDANAVTFSTVGRLSFQALTIQPRLELQFGYAPSLRLEAGLAFNYQFAPWLLRASALVGLTTGGASGFSFGYQSLLRAYPAHSLVRPQAFIANLELGYRLNLGNLGGILAAAPELRCFADVGLALDINAASSQWLWDVGIGLSVPGRWLGYLPFAFGMDLAFGPPGVRLNLYTGFPLP